MKVIMKIIEANISTTENRKLILELILKIPKLDWTEEQLDTWLKLNLGTDIFGAWLAIDEDVPVGVLTCEVIDQTIDPKVLISFCYVKPKLKGYADILLAKCEEWAKRLNIKKLLVTTTKRNFRGFEREHNFKFQRAILVKEL